MPYHMAGLYNYSTPLESGFDPVVCLQLFDPAGVSNNLPVSGVSFAGIRGQLRRNKQNDVIESVRFAQESLSGISKKECTLCARIFISLCVTLDFSHAPNLRTKLLSGKMGFVGRIQKYSELGILC